MISLRDVVTGFGNRDPLAEVWRRSLRGGGGGSAVITGVPPLRYIGDGRPLTDYLISGNAVQDGTPSPDAPVDATGSGVRTVNLFDKSTVKNGYYIDDANGNMQYNAGYVGILSASDFVYIGGASHLYIVDQSSHRWGAFYDSAKAFISGFNWFGDIIVPNNAAYVRITVNNDNLDTMMLNTGSTALPYEPYGYKLPLTVNSVEYPIYLGTVPTTRRVKKLVLTGKERLIIPSISLRVSIGAYIPCIAGYVRGVINTHFITNNTSEATPSYANAYTTRLGAAGSVTWFFIPRAFFSGELSVENCIAEFKAWLAAQYANGTPVTVWYVLAEPGTAVVNEPLMKIGDYADTISFAQSQVTIPTIDGENILDVPTEVPPSEIAIKGGISSV